MVVTQIHTKLVILVEFVTHAKEDGLEAIVLHVHKATMAQTAMFVSALKVEELAI